MSTAKDQVTRMLALVPYLRGNDGVPVEQVARDFGVKTRQIIKDLNVLWFCGLPEAVTGEMIDVDMDALQSDGIVYIDNAEFLPRPVRLTTHEAVALIVALRTLRSAAGPEQRVPVDAVLAKLEDAAGSAAEASQAVAVHVEDAEGATHDTLATALRDGRRVHLSYLVPSRDERTERDVDPIRLVAAEGRMYLEAWCWRAEDVRLFRLDRIESADPLDEPVADHTDLAPRDLSAGLFQPGTDAPEAVLDLEPNARWVVEHHPVEDTEERPNGVLRVRMRAGDLQWLRRFVLRQSGAVRVVAPPDLATQVVEDARAALAAYDRG